MFGGRMNRRRRYLVNKKMQLQFVFLLMAQICIPTVALGFSLFVVNNMYLSALQVIVGESVISEPCVQEILFVSVAVVVAFLIVSAALVTFLGVRFSHHIAGPLYKLKDSMARLARGEKVEHIGFRKSDIAEGLAEEFNAIAEKLNRLNK